ncbi:MAG: ribonuclease P protein component [Firmicutes bacterium]|nr:ribonuclease P protein component [Bacillota bacterium]
MGHIAVIKKNKEFRKVFGSGNYAADRYMVIYYKPNMLGATRFGFTVSKKTGKAVVRNRIRRLFKEACRLNRELFRDGFDYVLLARRDLAGRDYRQVEESIKKLLKRAFAGK